MEREYLDEQLRRLATEPQFRLAGWSGQEIREFRRLVQCARAANVEDDLRNMRVLRIELYDSGDLTSVACLKLFYGGLWRGCRRLFWSR